MVGRLIPLWRIYSPTILLNALMIIYAAIVKEKEKLRSLSWSQSGKFLCCEVWWYSILEIGFNHFLKIFGEVKKWKTTLKKLGGAGFPRGTRLFFCSIDSINSVRSSVRYLLLRALVHSLLWHPGNWGRRPHSRSGEETTDSQTQRHSKNATTLNIQWAQMSRARGLRGRRWSALLPIKHIIVRPLPDPCSTLAPGCMTYWLQCVATYTARGAACPGMTHHSHVYTQTLYTKTQSTTGGLQTGVSFTKTHGGCSYWGDFCIPWQRLTGGSISMVAGRQHPSGGLLWQSQRSERSASALCAKATQRAERATQRDVQQAMMIHEL